MENRRRFFDPAWQSIVVEIDGTPHEFRLNPSFWRGCRHFDGSVIRDWLRRNDKLTWTKGAPPRFTLEVIGNQRFRLRSAIDF
jgi:hypothetical protein